MANFKVPDCFLPTAIAPGDVILQAAEKREDGTQGRGAMVQFYCHGGILFHNCEYFKTLLSGAWKENELKILFVQDTDTDNTAPTLFDATKSKMLVIRATINFDDEEPSTIYQLLAFLYPHLSLTLTKDNWGPVMRLADKICLTGLSAVVDEFMRHEVLHVDPLSVLLWAYNNRKRGLFKECSTIVLDRMASGELNSLDVLPSGLQVQLANKRCELVQCMLQLIHQASVHVADYGELSSWSPQAQEAMKVPSSTSAVKLLKAAKAAAEKRQMTTQLVKSFENLTLRWYLELDIPDDADEDAGDGGEGEV